MKKSLMYCALQHLVLNDKVQMSNEAKLETLRELMKQEDLAKFAEDQEVKQNEGIQQGRELLHESHGGGRLSGG